MSIYGIGSKHLTDEELKEGSFSFDFDLADTLYIHLDPLEVVIQENDNTRLLDNRYLFSVRPAERRWYELVAPKIFGAINHKEQYTEILYSWYICHHPPLKRYHQRYRVVFQMERLIKDHRAFGYVSKAEYRAVKQPGEEMDFVIRYFPGKGAEESIGRIKTALQQRKRREPVMAVDEHPTVVTTRAGDMVPAIDTELLEELRKRGIALGRAKTILANTEPDFVRDHLKLYDDHFASGKLQSMKNPVTILISRIEEKAPFPPNFETIKERLEREAMQQASEKKARELGRLQTKYKKYRTELIDSFMRDNVSGSRLNELMDQTRRGEREKNPSYREDVIEKIAAATVRQELAKEISFMSFSEFCQQSISAETTGPAAQKGVEQ